MYTGLLHTHSLVRWIMLILLIITVLRAYNGWRSNSSFSPLDKRMSLFTLIFSHVQLLTGFVLYMVSPIVQGALADMSGTMKDSLLRFWAVEHILTMIIAIMIITIGYSVAKKAVNDTQKYKRIFIYYLSSLILILLTIPWPFMKTGAGRGWL